MCNSGSHICPLKVGSTSHDDTRMTFGLRWPTTILKQMDFSESQNKLLIVIILVIMIFDHECRLLNNVFSRLTYKASGQNPVLDYMISVEKLPERFSYFNYSLFSNFLDLFKYLDICSETSEYYEANDQTFSISGFNIVLERHYEKYL